VENGEKRGTALDIEADAIGHDLLWGTTTFVKDGPRQSVDPMPAGSWQSTAATAAPDAWAAPGVDTADEADPVLPMALDPAAGVLVGAGAGTGAGTSEAVDAPF